MNWDWNAKRLYCGENYVEFQANPIAKIVPILLAFVLLGPGLLNNALDVLNGKRPSFLDRPLDLPMAVAVVLLAWAALELCLGRSLRIDEYGVTQRVFFRSRSLSWREIRDYGYSYAGFGLARLYFSRERLETNSEGKKERASRCCGIRLSGAELRDSGRILTVCRRYTRVRPFLCSEEGKLVGVLLDR